MPFWPPAPPSRPPSSQQHVRSRCYSTEEAARPVAAVTGGGAWWQGGCGWGWPRGHDPGLPHAACTQPPSRCVRVAGASPSPRCLLGWPWAGSWLRVGVEAGAGWRGRGAQTHSGVFQTTELYCQSPVNRAAAAPTPGHRGLGPGPEGAPLTGGSEVCLGWGVRVKQPWCLWEGLGGGGGPPKSSRPEVLLPLALLSA